MGRGQQEEQQPPNHGCCCPAAAVAVVPHEIQQWEEPLRTMSEPQILQAVKSPSYTTSASASTGSLPLGSGAV